MERQCQGRLQAAVYDRWRRAAAIRPRRIQRASKCRRYDYCPYRPNFNWQSSSCTGVMLTGDLLLTNRHCAPKTDENFAMFCRQMVADLSWDGDAISHEFSCKEVVFSNTQADFMIVRLAPVNGGNIGASGTPAQVLSNETIPADRTLVMLHHAESLEKQVSFAGAILQIGVYLIQACQKRVMRHWVSALSAISVIQRVAHQAHPCSRDAGGWHVIGLPRAILSRLIP